MKDNLESLVQKFEEQTSARGRVEKDILLESYVSVASQLT